MTARNEFINYLLELLEQFGPISAKPMFGGFGICRFNLMFGLVSDDILYLKTDDKNRQDFESEGLPPFTYQRKGKDYAMSYYQVPEEALDNVEELCKWAKKAYEAAERSSKNSPKRKKARSRKKSKKRRY